MLKWGMLMRQLSLSLFLLCLSLSAFAQRLTVESFIEKNNDISASTNIRNDNNGTPCALVKVLLAATNATFEPNVIGDVDNKMNEYWVYLPVGSKHLVVKHTDYLPCDIRFDDYGISSLESKSTYELVLTIPNAVPVVKDTGDNMLAVSVKPSNSSLYINDELKTQEGSSPGTIGVIDGHEYVDLGLPSGLLWATCNVGASKPSDYGAYYAWGETAAKARYDWSNLKYCNDKTGHSFSKYNKDCEGTKDDKMELDLSDDAACVNWGGNWRMPTKDEWDELWNNCTWSWTCLDGHNGKMVTGKNGNSIFLPAAGYYSGNYLSGLDSKGWYWSSSLSSQRSTLPCLRWFCSGNYTDYESYYRHHGQTVRPVVSPLYK